MNDPRWTWWDNLEGGPGEDELLPAVQTVAWVSFGELTSIANAESEPYHARTANNGMMPLLALCGIIAITFAASTIPDVGMWFKVAFWHGVFALFVVAPIGTAKNPLIAVPATIYGLLGIAAPFVLLGAWFVHAWSGT